MRTPRVIIVIAFLLTTVLLTFISLRSSHPPQKVATSAAQKSGISSFFSIRAPFSLFPPNAIITLTHENSTAFLARPAAFGPSLPTAGLEGQVWIGSGFGDDAGSGGEVGCSDVPDWDQGSAKSGAARDGLKAIDIKTAAVSAKFRKGELSKGIFPYVDRSAAPVDTSNDKDAKAEALDDDGTDDYLQHPAPENTVPKSTELVPNDAHHADIQSIQEGAEIEGKVVLLSRGGCGFMEKVKWAQRRGAIALIVGDDTKGGPLIQMYAHGDTSNVTIPSIFTSRTTAHLLSTLIGAEGFIANAIDENGAPLMQSGKHRKSKKKQVPKTTFTPTAVAAKSTATHATKFTSKSPTIPAASLATERPGWFKRLFFGSRSSSAGSSRPPSSGQLDWVLVDEWKDDNPTTKKKSAPKNEKSKHSAPAKSSDDFQIGVQDWRDPDLVGVDGAKDAKATGKLATSKTKAENPYTIKAARKHTGGALQHIPEYSNNLRGGSITPGSGEYGGKVSAEEDRARAKQSQGAASTEGKSKGFLNAIFGDDKEDIEFPIINTASLSNDEEEEEEEDDDGDDEYEGLWVTLTPTSGASPFLDTLLVLVVSPLVTLTAVYALLLIRSRIRRRRWRAPKSVVEQLPVRTYQTITTPGTQSPRIPNTTSSSSTTPLLQNSPTRSRPRSRTTTGIPEAGLSRVNSHQNLQPPPAQREHEKLATSPKEWKKYTGKQVECVVCLEEYIDGVSRVMSLPCGHEFHADCITPWLTTRRRTCPICKGDVVRSLARGSPVGARYDPYQDDDDSDSDVQNQAALTINASSSAALPIPRDINEDLEQGIASPTGSTRPQSSSRSGSWRSILASSLNSMSRSPRPPEEDRNR
ncbi:hypothetical protein BJ878DRAFT_22074 [Calycina marina]|uniref:RING-type domain-containing protein n=1 Tax=Calycina marina TaxID=1763456 RepID=A0A9P7Z575_9HELO|nr:hypothetical protein BJ878DRAFT_22074 [Calycina marina]